MILLDLPWKRLPLVACSTMDHVRMSVQWSSQISLLTDNNTGDARIPLAEKINNVNVSR